MKHSILTAQNKKWIKSLTQWKKRDIIETGTVIGSAVGGGILGSAGGPGGVLFGSGAGGLISSSYFARKHIKEARRKNKR